MTDPTHRSRPPPKQIYFVDPQVRGEDGGEDGIVIRCNLDGTDVEIAADQNMSDPRVRLAGRFSCRSCSLWAAGGEIWCRLLFVGGFLGRSVVVDDGGGGFGGVLRLD